MPFLVFASHLSPGQLGPKRQGIPFKRFLFVVFLLNQVSQIEASIGFSDLNLDNKRIDENETLTGKRNGQLYTGSIRLRKFIDFNGLDYSFYSGINFTDIKLEKYDEAGGNKALRYFDQDNDYKELDLGIQISKLNDYKDYKIRTYTDLHYSRFLNKSLQLLCVTLVNPISIL